MNYINTLTGQYPISQTQIRSENPDTSYSEPFSPQEHYLFVFPTPQPAYNLMTEKVVESSPALTGKGHWEQTWSVIQLATDEIISISASKKVARLSAIDAEIGVLEESQARPIRELILDPTNTFPKNKLTTINTQITALRTERATLV